MSDNARWNLTDRAEAKLKVLFRSSVTPVLPANLIYCSLIPRNLRQSISVTSSKERRTTQPLMLNLRYILFAFDTCDTWRWRDFHHHRTRNHIPRRLVTSSPRTPIVMTYVAFLAKRVCIVITIFIPQRSFTQKTKDALGMGGEHWVIVAFNQTNTIQTPCFCCTIPE